MYEVQGTLTSHPTPPTPPPPQKKTQHAHGTSKHANRLGSLEAAWAKTTQTNLNGFMPIYALSNAASVVHYNHCKPFRKFTVIYWVESWGFLSGLTELWDGSSMDRLSTLVMASVTHSIFSLAQNLPVHRIDHAKYSKASIHSGQLFWDILYNIGKSM